MTRWRGRERKTPQRAGPSMPNCGSAWRAISVKLTLWLAALMLFLAACAPTDPYSLRSLAEGAIEATRQAGLLQAAQGTDSARGTEFAIDAQSALLDTQARATAQALQMAMLQADATR